MIIGQYTAFDIAELPIKNIDLEKFGTGHGVTLCYMHGADTIAYYNESDAHRGLAVSIINGNTSEWLFCSEGGHTYIRIGVPKADKEMYREDDNEELYGRIVPDRTPLRRRLVGLFF